MIDWQSQLCSGKKYVIYAVLLLIYIVTISVFYGTANRKKSDADGCIIYLCQRHHTGAAGVHFNKDLDLKIKSRCQEAYLKTYNKTIDEFIERYGRNYL